MTQPLEAHLRALLDDLKADAVAVHVNENGGGELSLMSHLGEAPREKVPLGITPVGEVAQTGIGLHRETRNTKAFKYHSHLYLPLGGTPPWGVLTVSAVAPNHFGDESRRSRAEVWAERLGEVLPTVPRNVPT